MDDPPDEQYDPDGDVHRFLDFSEPEPLPFLLHRIPPPPSPPTPPPPPPPPTQQFAPPVNNEFFVQPQPVGQWPPPNEGLGGSGPSSPAQGIDAVVSMIEGIEGFSVEEGSQMGPKPNEETMEEQIFQQFEPGQVDCSGCYVLREVLHYNVSRNLVFVVHGGLGTFDHAIFEVEHFGEGDQPPRKELFYVELRSRTYEWVKNFLIGCIMLLKSDTTGVMHDSISSFYDALCGDINLYLSRGSSYLEQLSQTPGTVSSAPQFPEPASGSSSSVVGETYGGFIGEAFGAWGSNIWEGDGVLPTVFEIGSSSSSQPHAMDGTSRFIPQTNNGMQAVNEGGNQFFSQRNTGRQASRPPPSSGKRSWLAIQRKRTANMRLSEFASYLHLPMTEAAKELNLCSTALKHVCRRNGVPRWPSRQINAIDRQITKLQGELVRGTRRGGLFAIKEEIEKLQARRARLYEGLES